MRSILLILRICVFTLILSTVTIAAGGGAAEGDGEILRRSDDPNPWDTNAVSYPGGPASKAPLATGYYAIDNASPHVASGSGGVRWTPTFTFIDTTGSDAIGWRRILSGPNQIGRQIWTQPGSQGHEYFRNPNDAADSTDNAVAGPISIGFPFHYYGRAYDSFYVSTNGLVGLTNRRYQYGTAGQRVAYNDEREDPRPVHSGGAAADTIPDDYGYQMRMLGNSTSPTAGLLDPDNTSFPHPTLGAVIAPLWDDQELSQFDSRDRVVADIGRVYWKRDQTGTKLIIYYVNMSMKGMKNIPMLDIIAQVPEKVIRVSFQLTLDRSDSSVQINFVRFIGGAQYPGGGYVLNHYISAGEIYRSNATIGLQSRDQEYTNYIHSDGFRGAFLINGNPMTPLYNTVTIRFRQWRNITRVLKAKLQMPSRSVPGRFEYLPNGESPNNFEVLLGHPTLGVVRPVGIVQNVSDSIGPVNRTPQPIRVNVHFRIRDIVNRNAQLLYESTKTSRSLDPIRVSIERSRDTVVFDPYSTNAQLLRQVGRFRAEVIATDSNPNGRIYGEQWPFDDTTGVLLFGITRQEIPFINTFNDFSVAEDGVIPNIRRWVSIGAKVVDGDLWTFSPPAPRGPATSSDGRVTLGSPVLQLDRRDSIGAYYNSNIPGHVGGDTLISFPLNLRTAGPIPPVLILSYQRVGRWDYPRGWSDQIRRGPEHAVYNTQKTTVLQNWDALMVEFAEPSPDGVENIVNVTKWRQSGFGDSTAAVRWGATSPRWGIFGGGGYGDTNGRVRINELDAGKDFQFYRTIIPIPARWTADTNANRYFRFRLIVAARNDEIANGPVDDNDEFYVDNVYLLSESRPEVEILDVGADWPYAQVPASQARAIPLYARVANNGANAVSTPFGVALSVIDRSNPPAAGLYSYYRYQTVLTVARGSDRIVQFPPWDAQICGASIPDTGTNPRPVSTTYRISGHILPRNYDSYGANDSTYEDFRLTLGPLIAFEDSSNQNEVPRFAGITGRGLNLVPPTQDGNGLEPYGPPGGTGTGSFATQFRIFARDTIRGIQAFYGSGNQAPDTVIYALYKQRPGASLDAPPDSRTPVVRVLAIRGQGVPAQDRGRQYHFDQYVTYMLPTPYVAEPGIYFVTVSQLAESGIELGADASRMGQVTTIRSDGTVSGSGNQSIPIHAEMRQRRFWFEDGAGSGNWNPMITATGNPGFPHLDWKGSIGSGNTYTRGSWIPMLRPYFGARGAGSCVVDPVELASFEVTPLKAALRLDWSTASELDNHGFHIERRVKGAEENWNDIGFASGAGTSNRPLEYHHIDNDVVAGTIYQYRLRQEDRDGAITHTRVREGMIAAAGTSADRLEQNTPNPFAGSTRIGFQVANSGTVSLEIHDIYGSVVRTFTIDAGAGRAGVIVWDGTNAQGLTVSNGIYIYKLVGEGFALARTMTLLR